MNLYIGRKGYYLYPLRHEKYFAQYKESTGKRVSKVFYELQYAIDWLNEN